MRCHDRTMSSDRPARNTTSSVTHSHARRCRRRGDADGRTGPTTGGGTQGGGTAGGVGGAPGGASTTVGGPNVSGTVPGPDSIGSPIGAVLPVTPAALRSARAIAAALGKRSRGSSASDLLMTASRSGATAGLTERALGAGASRRAVAAGIGVSPAKGAVPGTTWQRTQPRE